MDSTLAPLKMKKSEEYDDYPARPLAAVIFSGKKCDTLEVFCVWLINVESAKVNNWKRIQQISLWFVI